MATKASSTVAVVLFTRDLRLHDHPALVGAAEHADRVIPLFVIDDVILRSRFASPNRAAFLSQALAGLRAALRSRDADLVVRRGDVVAETMRVVRASAASALTCSADVSGYAHRRERLLEAACAADKVRFGAYPGVTVVPPGELRPAGSDHYRVFTPYWRAWSDARWRTMLDAPSSIPFARRLPVGRMPGLPALTGAKVSPSLPPGGEEPGRRLLATATRRARSGEPDLNNLAADGTSRLSPYLHFGCVSPLEAARRLSDHAPEQVRQLAWRDFHHQVTAAFPAITTRDYRDRGRRWRDDPAAVQAWSQGRTGVPIVDAGMRQLLQEGWMHNRSRLITAAFLTRSLGIDWRTGAAHFFHWLVDGDIANNSGNWQWVAGTGNDTRPNRRFNPLRQSRRFDPDGAYIRRYVPALRGVAGPDVHAPWLLPDRIRRSLDYPAPLIEI